MIKLSEHEKEIDNHIDSKSGKEYKKQFEKQGVKFMSERIKEIEDKLKGYLWKAEGSGGELLAEYKALLVKQDELVLAKAWCFDKGIEIDLDGRSGKYYVKYKGSPLMKTKELAIIHAYNQRDKDE